MKTLSRFCFLSLGLLALASTGCTVTGSGSIPSSVEGSNRNLRFTVDLTYNEDLETVEGSATFRDCAANLSATASFSEEDIIACSEALGEVDAIEGFLNESLEECLGIDDIDIIEDQVALIIGRYELTDDCRRRCRRPRWRRSGRNYCRRGRRGRGRGCRPSQPESNVIGTGCLIAVYVDCEQDGCIGDGMAVAMVDDSDPTQIFYTNCGILNSGDISVVYDDEITGSSTGTVTVVEFTPESGS